MFKGILTKWPVQKLRQGMTQKLLQHNDATDIIFLGFCVFLKHNTLYSLKIFEIINL